MMVCLLAFALSSLFGVTSAFFPPHPHFGHPAHHVGPPFLPPHTPPMGHPFAHHIRKGMFPPGPHPGQLPGPHPGMFLKPHPLMPQVGHSGYLPLTHPAMSKAALHHQLQKSQLAPSISGQMLSTLNHAEKKRRKVLVIRRMMSGGLSGTPVSTGQFLSRPAIGGPGAGSGPSVGGPGGQVMSGAHLFGNQGRGDFVGGQSIVIEGPLADQIRGGQFPDRPIDFGRGQGPVGPGSGSGGSRGRRPDAVGPSVGSAGNFGPGPSAGIPTDFGPGSSGSGAGHFGPGSSAGGPTDFGPGSSGGGAGHFEGVQSVGGPTDFGPGSSGVGAGHFGGGQSVGGLTDFGPGSSGGGARHFGGGQSVGGPINPGPGSSGNGAGNFGQGQGWFIDVASGSGGGHMDSGQGQIGGGGGGGFSRDFGHNNNNNNNNNNNGGGHRGIGRGGDAFGAPRLREVVDSNNRVPIPGNTGETNIGRGGNPASNNNNNNNNNSNRNNNNRNSNNNNNRGQRKNLSGQTLDFSNPTAASQASSSGSLLRPDWIEPSAIPSTIDLSGVGTQGVSNEPAHAGLPRRNPDAILDPVGAPNRIGAAAGASKIVHSNANNKNNNKNNNNNNNNNNLKEPTGLVGTSIDLGAGAGSWAGHASASTQQNGEAATAKLIGPGLDAHAASLPHFDAPIPNGNGDVVIIDGFGQFQPNVGAKSGTGSAANGAYDLHVPTHSADVDVLTLDNAAYAKLEQALASGQEISPSFLDQIIRGSSTSTLAAGAQSAPNTASAAIPEIFVIDGTTGQPVKASASAAAAPATAAEVATQIDISESSQSSSTKTTKTSSSKTEVAIGGHDAPPHAAAHHDAAPHGGHGPVGVVGAPVGSIEVQPNDVIGVFSMPDQHGFPHVPASVSSIPASIGKRIGGRSANRNKNNTSNWSNSNSNSNSNSHK
ncbi:hypothetical protein DPMN_167812 [Dreissena polymorpha]|uniref:Uncharacterized protein n=1 Tax=Dreissena polymorpha TaxID=45954 RepID=A0A9D4F0J6_DREPO|nr:hypothetical protein DPMN_167812 [Dreissena polymorpha]